MTQKPKKQRNSRLKRVHWPLVVLIFGIILLLIPTTLVGKLLYDAFISTGQPIFGSRFDVDLNPAITTEQLDEITGVLSNHSSVDKASVNLKSATLRITVDVNDDQTPEEIQELVEGFYDQILTILDKGLYFTVVGSSKQYDLELHVFNNLNLKDEENYVYVMLNLNSTMEEPLIQLVSDPKNPEYVQELYERIANQNNPSDDEDDEDEGE